MITHKGVNKFSQKFIAGPETGNNWFGFGIISTIFSFTSFKIAQMLCKHAAEFTAMGNPTVRILPAVSRTLQLVSSISRTFVTTSCQAWWCYTGYLSAVISTLNCAWSRTEYTLADARHISKTSSVRPAAQQHVLSCDRLPAASMWRHGCEPSLENAPSLMPDLLHGTHCHQTFVLQPTLPCSRNYSKRTF